MRYYCPYIKDLVYVLSNYDNTAFLKASIDKVYEYIHYLEVHDIVSNYISDLDEYKYFEANILDSCSPMLFGYALYSLPEAEARQWLVSRISECTILIDLCYLSKISEAKMFYDNFRMFSKCAHTV
tara:strand:- start:1053 stop:1430 length:378 start_codon:yes stop_codon:yes gene_type:complete